MSAMPVLELEEALPELGESPTAAELYRYQRTLIEMIRLAEHAGQAWLRERLVDVLYYDRRRWCWEVPFLLPPAYAERAAIHALPSGVRPHDLGAADVPTGFQWPTVRLTRSGSRRVECPRCPTIIVVGRGARIPARCDFCQAPLLPSGLRVLPLPGAGS